jgi:hypothetical protein
MAKIGQANFHQRHIFEKEESDCSGHVSYSKRQVISPSLS